MFGLWGVFCGVLLVSGCVSSKPGVVEPTQEQLMSGVWNQPPVGGYTLTFEEVMLRLREGREAWGDRPALDLPRHPAEKYLKGWVIVLDPGHGGKGLEVPTWKAGPTGQREAVMNLRVALMLREMLVQAGATVGLTRETEFNDIADDRIGDYDHGADKARNTLELRAEFANNFPRPDGGKGADLFISLHHNASSSPTTNWGSVWFHGPVGDAEVELDAAKAIAHHLALSMRQEETGKTSPMMNDKQMYAGGFGVLRQSRVPAILTEASFFSHLEEEQRLADPGYLVREAYGLYVALCELAYGGRPTQSLPVVSVSGGRATVTTTLGDGLPGWWGSDLGRVLPGSVSVEVNGERVPSSFDPKAGTVTAEFDPDPAGPMVIALRHQNFFKHSNWPQRYRLNADATVEPLGSARSGVGLADEPTLGR